MSTPDPASATLAPELRIGTEQWFARRGVPQLIAGWRSESAMDRRAAPLILVGAAGLALLVRGWLGEGSWPRTPTLVWSVLLLPVGVGLVQGTRTLVGWVVVLVALGCAVAAWVAREADAEVVPGSDRTDPGAG